MTTQDMREGQSSGWSQKQTHHDGHESSNDTTSQSHFPCLESKWYDPNTEKSSGSIIPSGETPDRKVVRPGTPAGVLPGPGYHNYYRFNQPITSPGFSHQVFKV